MKKAFLTISMATAVVMTYSSAHAARSTSKSAPVAEKPIQMAQKTQGDIAAIMLQQILNSIEFRAMDFNINNMSITGTKDAVTKEMKHDVQMKDVDLSAKLRFKSDWSVDTFTLSESTPKNAQIEKLIPKVVAESEDLYLIVKAQKGLKASKLQAEFFDNVNKTGKWQPRPLVVNIGNAMTRSVLKINIRSLSVYAEPAEKNPEIQVARGTCVADKLLYDFDSGESKSVQVNCSFNATLSDKGYEIKNFRFNNN